MWKIKWVMSDPEARDPYPYLEDLKTCRFHTFGMSLEWPTYQQAYAALQTMRVQWRQRCTLVYRARS